MPDKVIALPTAPVIERALAPINGAELYEEAYAFVRRYVMMSDDEAIAVALWTMATHAIDCFGCIGYLNIDSPEKGTGKSRLLEVLALLVKRPWLTGRVPAITLALKLDREKPTLLLDETDAAFGASSSYTDLMRGVLNTGYKRSGRVTTREKGEPVDLSTFGPKAFAGIGSSLPATVAHRSIRINLQRKLPTDNINKFREQTARVEAEPIHARLTMWAELFAYEMHAEPKGLENLPDRPAEICESLLIIAESCGEPIAAAARKALLNLCAGGDEEFLSPGAQGLAAIRDLFEESFSRPELFDANPNVRKLRSSDIAKRLGMTEKMVSRLLAKYGIRPQAIRFGAQSLRGYFMAQFADAWSRYLPPK
jgi:hypothetical protein